MSAEELFPRLMEEESKKIITGFLQEGERHEYTCYWEWF